MVHVKTEPHHINIGRIGENIATDYLSMKGYSIVERNFRRKAGEIDIIASKNRGIYFVEVKSVVLEKLELNNNKILNSYRPEDNMHENKAKRLKRTIILYLSEHKYDDDYEWQFDVITVEIDQKNKNVRINHIKDIIL